MTKSRKVLSIILAVVMAFAALPMMFASAEEVVTAPTMADVATAVEEATYEAIGSTSADTAATAVYDAVVAVVADDDVTVAIAAGDYVAYTAAVVDDETTTDVDETAAEVMGSFKFTATLTKGEDTATTEEITVVVGAASLLDTVDGAVSFIDSLIASITEFVDMIKAFFLALDIITLIF